MGKKTKEKINKFELASIGIFVLLFLISVLQADEIVFKFKSPSFSGINSSSHYLTIQNQEFNRKEALKAEIKALQDEIERDKILQFVVHLVET